MSEKISWMSIFLEEMQDFEETWDDVVTCTATLEQINRTVKLIEPGWDEYYFPRAMDPYSVYAKTSKRLYFIVDFEGVRYPASLPIDFKEGDEAKDLMVS